MEMLLDTLKWSCAVGMAALILTCLKPLLDRRYSPKWRYSVWLVLSILLLLAPVQWETLLPQTERPSFGVRIEVPQMEVTVSREEGLRLQSPLGGATVPAGSQGAVVPRMRLDKALPALWLLGAAGFALYHLLGTLFLQYRTRRWSRNPGTGTLETYQIVCREMKVRNAPPLRVSSRVDSPMLMGLFRPCLVLPKENPGEQALRFILCHELTHYRRRDLWYKMAVLTANAVHWFNPLVYLLRREASQDMELTCDALVVAGAGPETRRAYSETLLASVHRQKGLWGRSALSTHFYGGAEVMKERFRNILGKRGRKWGGVLLALTLLATAASACAVGVSQAKEPAEPAAPEEVPSAESRELTADELTYFANNFNPALDDGLATDAKARNGLLRFPYDRFEDIGHYLELLFYDAGEPVTDEAELAALEKRMNSPIETDCLKLTREYIRDFLTRYFAVGVTEEALDRLMEEAVSLPNLEEYDAFYWVHGDTMMNLYTFDRGVWEPDGTVKLYYKTNLYVWEDNGELNILWDQPMCAALRLTENDVWGMVSNMIAEE